MAGTVFTASVCGEWRGGGSPEDGGPGPQALGWLGTRPTFSATFSDFWAASDPFLPPTQASFSPKTNSGQASGQHLLQRPPHPWPPSILLPPEGLLVSLSRGTACPLACCAPSCSAGLTQPSRGIWQRGMKLQGALFSSLSPPHCVNTRRRSAVRGTLRLTIQADITLLLKGHPER